MFQLLDYLLGCEHVRQTHRRSAIEQRERHSDFRVTFPDELQHQQLVEIRIEQGSDKRVQFPVVVVCTRREIDDHC
jgi:hypothetical protein